MNEEQFRELKQNEKIKINPEDFSRTDSQEEDEPKEKSFIQEEIEVAEYTLFGLALGFIVIVCLFYLLNHYNTKQEMIERVQKQIEEVRGK